MNHVNSLQATRTASRRPAPDQFRCVRPLLLCVVFTSQIAHAQMAFGTVNGKVQSALSVTPPQRVDSDTAHIQASHANAQSGRGKDFDPPSFVGPRVPVGPQKGLSCPFSAVLLHPTDSVNTIVAHHPAGTTYCFAPGTYTSLQITPKSGDRYVGQPGATLDGGGTAIHAFLGGGDNVMIQNLVIQNYNAPIQDAPVSNCASQSSNWIIANNEIARNGNAGVLVCGSGTHVVANYLHDNVEEGYACTGGRGFGGSNISITDNEIAHNNPTGAVDPQFEAGGGKCTGTTNLVTSYNYVHDNHGPGIWTDIDNQTTDVEFNRVENNWSGGIFHEISWDAVIAHNLVHNNANALYCTGWLWCGEIQIAASGGVNEKTVEIFNNAITSAPPGNGLVLIQQERGTGLYGTHLVQNVHFHENCVDMSAGGNTGGVTDNGDNGLFSTQGNTFNYDEYTSYVASAFWWNNSTGNLPWFQSQGQELNGEQNATHCLSIPL